MNERMTAEEWKQFINGKIKTLTSGNKIFINNFPKTFEVIGNPNIDKSEKGRKGLWYELWTFFNLTEVMIDRWSLDQAYFLDIDPENRVIEKNNGSIDWKSYWNAGNNLKKKIEQSLPVLSLRNSDEEAHIWLQYWLTDIDSEEESQIDIAIGFGELNLDLESNGGEIEEALISLGGSPLLRWYKDDGNWYYLENTGNPDVIIECKSSQVDKKQIEKYSNFDADKHLLLKYGEKPHGDLGQFNLIDETKDDFKNKKIRKNLKDELRRFMV